MVGFHQEFQDSAPSFPAHVRLLVLLLLSASWLRAIMPAERYTILFSGVTFRFTKDQLESEPGNYFATYFLGNFQEANQRCEGTGPGERPNALQTHTESSSECVKNTDRWDF